MLQFRWFQVYSPLKKDCHTSTLSDHQERELLELRKEFADVISDDPGKTDVMSHDIVTDNATPIHLPPYRLPHTSHEFLRKEIKGLLDLGIITPSRSPWAAPVVLVAKKDGGKRLRGLPETQPRHQGRPLSHTPN